MGSAYVNIYIPAFSFDLLETDLMRKFSIFTARRYASAVYPMALCIAVLVEHWLVTDTDGRVCHKPVFY